MPWSSTVATLTSECQSSRILIRLAAMVQVLFMGCQRVESLPATEKLDRAQCPFDIYWPPRDPQDSPPAATKPLLRGTLEVDVKQVALGGAELRLTVTIQRPSGEEDRQFWNAQLAFADIAWMKDVRVWDAEGKWLWPNLPHLLRLFGQERMERYGGMDPGKHVDNDFAAVLIRKYDARGQVEALETKNTPLMSAGWHPAGTTDTDGQTIVHVAKSDTFLLHLGGEHEPNRGQIKVWLIYADFLGARPPRTWPKDREWAGGILGYFEIDWETSPGHDCRGVVRPKRPGEGTGFKWAEWVVRAPGSAESEAHVRLSDDAK